MRDAIASLIRARSQVPSSYIELCRSGLGQEAPLLLRQLPYSPSGSPDGIVLSGCRVLAAFLKQCRNEMPRLEAASAAARRERARVRARQRPAWRPSYWSGGRFDRVRNSMTGSMQKTDATARPKNKSDSLSVRPHPKVPRQTRILEDVLRSAKTFEQTMLWSTCRAKARAWRAFQAPQHIAFAQTSPCPLGALGHDLALMLGRRLRGECKAPPEALGFGGGAY
jgi:hypothetical protein